MDEDRIREIIRDEIGKMLIEAGVIEVLTNILTETLFPLDLLKLIPESDK